MQSISTSRNLHLLWWLRTIAISGQVVAIAIATQWLQIPLTLAPLILILSFSVTLNTYTLWRLRRKTAISEREFSIHLVLDIFALYGLLYFTGGATNPFTSLFILQVVFAAITLPQRYTWSIASLTITLYTLLFFWNVEVPYLQHHHLGEFFSLHVQGMWVSFVLLACIVSWFVVRMNATIRRQDALLAQAEKVTALGTLATSAVHELGTPLSTIAVIASDCEPDTAQRITEQLARCKQILSGITQAGGVARAESASPIALRDFLTHLAEQWANDHPHGILHINLSQLGEHRILAELGFTKALINLLNNAAEASPESVTLTAKSTSQRVIIEVIDGGDGIAGELQSRLGQTGQSTKPKGLGLGLFLTNSVVTRMGGTLRFIPAPGKGVIARITLPLKGLLV